MSCETIQFSFIYSTIKLSPVTWRKLVLSLDIDKCISILSKPPWYKTISRSRIGLAGKKSSSSANENTREVNLSLSLVTILGIPNQDVSRDVR